MPDKVPYFNPDDDDADVFDPRAREREFFYRSARWKRHRRAYLAKHPLCAHCLAAGRTGAADSVHHIIERLDDPSKSFDWSNLESLCRSCHTLEHNRRKSL